MELIVKMMTALIISEIQRYFTPARKNNTQNDKQMDLFGTNRRTKCNKK